MFQFACRFAVHCVSKKRPTVSLTISLPNINRFFEIFAKAYSAENLQ